MKLKLKLLFACYKAYNLNEHDMTTGIYILSKLKNKCLMKCCKKVMYRDVSK